MYVCVCARAADCRSSTAERREVGLVHSRADGTRGTSWAGRSARCTATTATAATTPFTTTTPLTTTTTAAAATAALEPTAGTGRFDVAQVNLEQVLFLALALALGLFAGGGLDVHVAVVITNEGLGGLPLLVRLAALVRLARGLDAELVRLVLVPLGNVFSIRLVLFLGGGALGLLLRFGGGFSLFLLGNGLAEPLVLVLGRAVFLAPTALNGLGGIAVIGSVTGKKKKKHKELDSVQSSTYLRSLREWRSSRTGRPRLSRFLCWEVSPRGPASNVNWLSRVPRLRLFSAPALRSRKAGSERQSARDWETTANVLLTSLVARKASGAPAGVFGGMGVPGFRGVVPLANAGTGLVDDLDGWGRLAVRVFLGVVSYVQVR